MEDKDSKNKKNLENWKTVNFDFASLYPETFRMSDFYIKNILRKVTTKEIWKKEI
jgi:hypothetical protein